MKLTRAAISALPLCPVEAVPAPKNIPMTPIFGVGFGSCATWLADPTTEYVGNQWIFGMWTGMNTARAAQVGDQTDASGILAEVKRDCQTDPSLKLWSAIIDVYGKFMHIGR